ncbi:hypothetical protein N658DRAFT_527203 [Parathielavia hyrcaniae]|uniref:Uncharacterized protein n=1 Tax=Parathielavia hyrcaniae TaxID=113614 RepID=A0AAN6SX83_9PEZI|nr:hypothetical protein N658DRAFT_527203 [Parathielavia hyrcaniae]
MSLPKFQFQPASTVFGCRAKKHSPATLPIPIASSLPPDRPPWRGSRTGDKGWKRREARRRDGGVGMNESTHVWISFCRQFSSIQFPHVSRLYHSNPPPHTVN